MYQYVLPSSLPEEINNLERLIMQHREGKLSAAQLKAHRVPFGVYEQRQKGSYMIRIRCAAGIVSPDQLRTISRLANEYGSGRLHVTTRQELQIHDCRLENIVPALRTLADAGLSSRGGGGNTVRNITASWNAGIAPEEVFDVTPCAVELTSRLVALSDSWELPRKFKIAFSNGPDDNALATVNDLGFIATEKKGQSGFRVYVAGGMGRSPQPGQLLHSFVPVSDVFVIAESVKRLFSRYGNRRNRHTARLRFLWNSLGRDSFIRKYTEIVEEIRKETLPPFNSIVATDKLPDTTVPSPLTPAPGSETGNSWKIRHTGMQKQTGLHWVRIPLALGDLTSDQALSLAQMVAPFGDDTMRCTRNQNIVLRNIPVSALTTLYQEIGRVFPQHAAPALLADAVACAGASTCQLGICLSRGALQATSKRLLSSSLDVDALGDFRLHFSGCSNSCGQHGTADLGFHGKSGRKGNHAYPAYTVVAGGSLDAENGAILAKRFGDIAARNVPLFVESFLEHYLANKAAHPSFQVYLDKTGETAIRALCEKYREIPDYESAPEYYRDWDADSDFSLEGRGTGECASGLFDLIDLDLNKVRSIRGQLIGISDPRQMRGLLVELANVSMRALLPAAGVTAQSTRDLPKLFKQHFIETGLIGSEFAELVSVLERGSDELTASRDLVIALSLEIERLYAGLDDSLRFHPTAPAAAPTVPVADLEKDFRGISCPMNFVKAKMALTQLSAGQVLRILLDDGEPIDNVPRSIESEGHTLISTIRQSNYWEVTIRKGP